MKPNRLRRGNSGFTLVELMIVVIILAILAAIIVPQFAGSTAEAKNSALDANLNSMRSMVEVYYQQHGVYPGVNASSGGTPPRAVYCFGRLCPPRSTPG